MKAEFTKDENGTVSFPLSFFDLFSDLVRLRF